MLLTVFLVLVLFVKTLLDSDECCFPFMDALMLEEVLQHISRFTTLPISSLSPSPPPTHPYPLTVIIAVLYTIVQASSKYIQFVLESHVVFHVYYAVHVLTETRPAHFG